MSTSAPNPPPSSATRADERRASRVGLFLFAVYVLFYGTFVGLCAFGYDTLRYRIAGVNLAVIYGMGLIALALVLALVYMFLARSTPSAGGKA